MNEPSQSQPADGKIISAKADEQGVIHVETFHDGAIHEQAIAREGFMRNGEYQAPPVDAPLNTVLPNGVAEEGRVLDARVNADGSIAISHVVGGEVRTTTYDEEPVAHAPPPVPNEVYFSPVNELDALVHDMAVDTQYTSSAVLEAELEPVAPTVIATTGAFTVIERDQYGDLRSHTYDTEPVMRTAAPPLDVYVVVADDGTVNAHEGLHDAHESLPSATTDASQDSPSHLSHGATDPGGHPKSPTCGHLKFPQVA